MSAIERLDRKTNDLCDVNAALACINVDDLETAARTVTCPPVSARVGAMLNLVAELEAYRDALEESIARLEPEAIAEAEREQAEEIAAYMEAVE
jgi:hypothetical protein